MTRSWIRRWFSGIERRDPRPACRPGVLLLEDRLVPATWQDLTALPASPTNAPSYIHPDHARPIAIDTAESDEFDIRMLVAGIEQLLATADRQA